MWLFSDHCRAWSAACWSWLSPASQSQTSHSELSSTYLLMFTSVRRSLMWMTSPTCPKSVPWGTPALMVVHSDTMSPSLVHWQRPHRKEVTYLVRKSCRDAHAGQLPEKNARMSQRTGLTVTGKTDPDPTGFVWSLDWSYRRVRLLSYELHCITLYLWSVFKGTLWARSEWHHPQSCVIVISRRPIEL